MVMMMLDSQRDRKAPPIDSAMSRRA